MLNLNEGYFTDGNEFVSPKLNQTITDPFLLVLLLSDPAKAKAYLAWYDAKNVEALEKHVGEPIPMFHLERPEVVVNVILDELYGTAFNGFYYTTSDSSNIHVETVCEATAYRLA